MLEFSSAKQTSFVPLTCFSTTTRKLKMALIQTINPSDLYHMACNMGRGKQFGYDGWLAIGDYLEDLSDQIGENIEIDIVGICCEYSMSEDVSDWWKECGVYSDIDSDEWEEMDDEEKLEAIENYLNQKYLCSLL